LYINNIINDVNLKNEIKNKISNYLKKLKKSKPKKNKQIPNILNFDKILKDLNAYLQNNIYFNLKGDDYKKLKIDILLGGPGRTQAGGFNTTYKLTKKNNSTYPTKLTQKNI
jgi:hypothetical protein